AVAIDAGLSTLISQALFSMVENNGNLLAVFKDLGSADFLVQLVTAMATVGLTSGLSNGALGALGLDSLVGQTTLTLAQRAQRAAVLIAVRTSVNTAAKVLIRGEKLDKALLASLRSSAAAAIGSELTQEIGEAVLADDIDTATRLIAHAAVGCGTGAIATGDCASGAVGAVTGELAGMAYAAAFADKIQADLKELDNQGATVDDPRVLNAIAEWQAGGANIAALVAGLSGILINGDADLAAQTGQTAAENNALFTTIMAIIAVGALFLEVTDKVLLADSAVSTGEAALACSNGSAAACGEARELASGLAVDLGLEFTIGAIIPGSLAAKKLFQAIVAHSDPATAVKLTKMAVNNAPIRLPENPSQIGHIFRDMPGHLPDTPKNRQLLLDTCNNSENILGPNRFGNEVYALIQADGSQIWVEIRNGVIQNGGVNTPPRTWIPGKGLQ
uniref:DUF637 domain-containing protein n=1 Tax=Rhodospirillum sp. A1_3_36 TaxID=3391666 RepID=UPI0039A4EC2A